MACNHIVPHGSRSDRYSSDVVRLQCRSVGQQVRAGSKEPFGVAASTQLGALPVIGTLLTFGMGQLLISDAHDTRQESAL